MGAKMNASFTRKIRQAGLVLAFAVSVSALSTSRASLQFGRAADVHRRRVPSLQLRDPDIPAITACMIKHRAQLSAGCRTVMDHSLSKQGKNVAATD